MTKPNKIGRREFLRRSTAGAVGLGMTAGMARNVLGANDRIRVGVIGVGGMGGHHLSNLVEYQKKGKENVEVVAVCDAFEKRRLRAKQVTGGKADDYIDYHEMIDRKDIDVCWTATPDHVHAPVSIDVMESGKDIYCEKPMTRFWEQAKRVYATVKKTNRIMQIGSQSCSSPCWHKAGELIKEGKIGKLVWVQTSAVRNARKDTDERDYTIDAEGNEKTVFWKGFLAEHPMRTFDPVRFFRWRKFWDYSGGITTEWFSHNLHKLMPVIGMDYPVRAVAGGGVYCWKGDREPPTTIHVVVDYPAGHSVMLLGCMVNEHGVSTVVHGHEANMFIGSTITIRPEAALDEEGERQTEQIRVGGAPQGDEVASHHHNFLECVRSRKEPNCSVEYGLRAMAAICMANDCYRENKVKFFNAEKMEIV
ncbi:MAG: Gfo/Idh/MocA family oxidoreductase [Planctomycetota bacterium]